jgi:hypothetical protein
VGQVATVISSIRPFARVCQGIGRIVGVGHHAAVVVVALRLPTESYA